MIKRSSLALIWILFLTLNAQSQDFLRVDGQQIVNADGNFIIKSIGTGNWMIQEGYMMQSTRVGIGTHTQFRNKLEEVMGEEKTAEYYEHWLNNHFTKTDLDSMKAWGFNALRPALHYKWFTLPIEEEPVKGENTWIEAGFDKLDELMDWGAENEMYIMLDMHGAPGGQGKNSNINDYDETLPSLFESEENRDKLVALWVKLAERYKDNPWFGGYDFINEPNWKLGGNGNPNGCGSENNDELWDLHLRLTKAVREIDQNHIIYISGNCWGNNYSSFENHPLNSYDDNTVITFHKYWNINDQESIQWALDMREKYNRPLWMSESGENSNQWFADAIYLFEQNNIGWSWWPVKKSRVNNIFKVKTPESYNELLDSWDEGNEPLNAEETFAAVMDYSEAHKTANTTVARDVIYAMINNQDPKATKPFKEHLASEWIAFVDYDLGRDGYAYDDKVSDNIRDENNRSRSWNDGRMYRNDGVDIGKIDDDYYVGWTEEGEWLQFTLYVEEEGRYKIEIESSGDAGSISVEVNGEVAVGKHFLTSSKEWQKSSTGEIVLPNGELKLRFRFTEGGPFLKTFSLKKS